jgi:hypothetical protein
VKFYASFAWVSTFSNVQLPMPIYDILVKNGEKLGCNCACRLGAALVLVFAGWAYSFKLRYVSHCHCHDVTASRNLQMTRGQQKNTAAVNCSKCACSTLLCPASTVVASDCPDCQNLCSSSSPESGTIHLSNKKVKEEVQAEKEGKHMQNSTGNQV